MVISKQDAQPTTTTTTTTTGKVVSLSGSGGTCELDVEVASKTIIVKGVATNIEGGELAYTFEDSPFEQAWVLVFRSTTSLVGHVWKVDPVDLSPISDATTLDRDSGGAPCFGCVAPADGSEACYQLWFDVKVASSGTGLVGGTLPDTILPPTEANPKFVLRTKRNMPLSGPKPQNPTMDPDA